MQGVSDELVQLGKSISTASLHEAYGRKGALPSTIKPVGRSMRVSGRAFPILCPPGDNLWLHYAIYVAAPGDVLIADTANGDEFGYWGEVMAVAAMARGIGGLVIRGGVRDAERLAELGFPVFSGRVCIRGTGKDPYTGGSLGAPVQFGDVAVRRGDLVVGDADGVVVVSAADAAVALAQAERRDQEEQRIFERLRAGETTIAIYDLPQLQEQPH